jgi:hypothetical protein
VHDFDNLFETFKFVPGPVGMDLRLRPIRSVAGRLAAITRMASLQVWKSSAGGGRVLRVAPTPSID